MKPSKIAIIGAGHVGSTTAHTLILKNIVADILLVDVNESRCKGEILDLSDTLSFSATSGVTHATPKEAASADIIIITAGIAQKPGQTRVELLQANAKIVHDIFESLKPINPNAIVIMVTNPVDTMTLLAQKLSGLPHNQVFGSGTILDTQRLCNAVAQKLHIAEQSIYAYVLGEHGDTQFPAWSTAYIAGIPLVQFPKITNNDLKNIQKSVRNKAYEIIKCKGATFFGIAACIAELCEKIIFDQKRVAPVSCYQQKFKICFSTPAVIGADGIEQILLPPLNKKENEQLQHSISTLQSYSQDLE